MNTTLIVPTGFRSKFYVLLSTTQTISPTTWTVLNFDDIQYDGENEFDAITNHRFVAKRNGYYSISAGVAFSLWEADKRCKLDIQLNGIVYGREHKILANVAEVPIVIHRNIHLNKNDYLDIQVYHFCTASKIAMFQSYSTYFSGFRYA